MRREEWWETVVAGGEGAGVRAGRLAVVAGLEIRRPDLEKWELLPDEGFLEINDDGGQKIYTRKDSSSSLSSSSFSDIQMNYFICAPKTGRHRHHRLLPVSIDLQSQQTPLDVKIESVSAGEQEPAVSQVFFKKLKETEFVDMKVDSPKSCRGIIPRKDFQFVENVDINTTCKEAADDDKVDRSEINGEMELDHDDDEDEEGGVVNTWKWIGAAICSFGVAAATFCVVSFSIQRVNNKHPKQNQKRIIKQVVHRANKLNEASSSC